MSVSGTSPLFPWEIMTVNRARVRQPWVWAVGEAAPTLQPSQRTSLAQRHVEVADGQTLPVTLQVDLLLHEVCL